MQPRLAEEWDDIVSFYPDAQHTAGPERVTVTLELAPGIYTCDVTPVAVLVPPGYRTTSPDGFLVPASFGFASADPFPAGDASGLGLPGWLAVSFHMIDANGVSTWRPTADPHKGDNFTGYLQSIEAFLARRCN
jgi:hypothetical protein